MKCPEALRPRRDGIVLVRGVPGTGKTTTALALSQTVGTRVFYVNPRRCPAAADVLVEGIRRRLTRPTAFVFDDCHERFDELLGFHDQASRLLRGRGWIVLVARTTSGGESGPRFEDSELEDDLVTAGSAVEFKNTQAFFQQVVERRRPELSGLSKDRMHRLFERSAHNLALLDAVLASVREPADIDRLGSEQISETALKHYFGRLPLTADRLFDLTALAQFELAPPADWLPLDDLRREAPHRAEKWVVPLQGRTSPRAATPPSRARTRITKSVLMSASNSG